MPVFYALIEKLASFGFVLSVPNPQSSVLSLYEKITYRDFTNFENGFVLQKNSLQSPVLCPQEKVDLACWPGGAGHPLSYAVVSFQSLVSSPQTSSGGMAADGGIITGREF